MMYVFIYGGTSLGDGTVMLLNTEDLINQEAVVYFDSKSFKRVNLAPGELNILDGNGCIKWERLRERLVRRLTTLF